MLLKKKKYLLKFVLCVVIMISTLDLSAQTKILSINDIDKHVKNGLLNNYHPDSIALSKLCRRACVFVKFKVDNSGKITEIALSKDSILFINDALIRAVNSLQNDVALVGALKASGKTIIQPFQYYYQAGCEFPKTAWQANVAKDKNDNDKKKSEKNYFQVRDEMEFFGATIWDMLNFSNGKLSAIDCILLSPIQVASGSME